MSGTPPPLVTVGRVAWSGTPDGGPERRGERVLAEETAVALTYNRVTHAVLMASPADLEDFAVGFSLTDGVVASPTEIEELEIVAVRVPVQAGCTGSEPGADPRAESNGSCPAMSAPAIELRMWVGEARIAALTARRRGQAGPTGCGLCGIESLAEALRPPRPVASGRRIAAAAIPAAMRSLAGAQDLNRAARSLHAAAFWTPEAGLVAVREDVGRHNALDKLAGALARRDVAAASGAVLLTSRVSVELVQKAASIGVPVLAAISAPTMLAVRAAETAGIALIGIARDDSFEVFTRADRIDLDAFLPGRASRPG